MNRNMFCRMIRVIFCSMIRVVLQCEQNVFCCVIRAMFCSEIGVKFCSVIRVIFCTMIRFVLQYEQKYILPYVQSDILQDDQNDYQPQIICICTNPFSAKLIQTYRSRSSNLSYPTDTQFYGRRKKPDRFFIDQRLSKFCSHENIWTCNFFLDTAFGQKVCLFVTQLSSNAGTSV